MRKKPTIDDVAREAGVARATVSRVLNASPNTSEEVRSKVIQAVEKLGYQVNHQARQLASGASSTVAVVFAAAADAEPNSYYHSAIELGAMRAASDLGYGLVAHTFDPADERYRERIAALVSQGRCDGLVLTPPFSDDLVLIEQLQGHEFPFVLVSAGPQARERSPSVGIDDRQAGVALGSYLLARGHRRFGYIGGPPEHRSAALRLEGLLAAVEDFGLDRRCVQVTQGNFTFKSGIDLAGQLLAPGHRPTVLVCANDDMAAGALFSAHRMGLNVPGDVSITGFDDTPVSQIVWPPLTTIHQPLRQIGAKAVDMLIAAGAGDAKLAAVGGATQLVPYELVERASTAGPAPAIGISATA